MRLFLQIASQKLNVQGQRLFSEHGAEIDDTRLIRDNDIVYISQGEGFLGRVGAFFCDMCLTKWERDPEVCKGFGFAFRIFCVVLLVCCLSWFGSGRERWESVSELRGVSHCHPQFFGNGA